jgi:hypothetical protein
MEFGGLLLHFQKTKIESYPEEVQYIFIPFLYKIHSNTIPTTSNSTKFYISLRISDQ